MKRTILTVINIIAVLAFFEGIGNADAGHFLAGALISGISLGWLHLFAYANRREHDI